MADLSNVATGPLLDSGSLQESISELLRELYPIPRSITGDGVRRTLRAIQRHIPLEIHEVPTGVPIFDWAVPREWNIRDAWIKNEAGDVVISFRASNLHVVGYSVPVHRMMNLSELKSHLFSDPAHPKWIPYRTAYFEDTWGFCLSHEQLLTLQDGRYEVFIDASLTVGSLTYGECFLPGARTDEILIACHTCHPSLANDSLSGVVLATFLARAIASADRTYSFRFLFAPGTIGAIAWLALNEMSVGAIKHGLVVTCVGDGGPFTYKQSRRGDAEIDQAVAHVLRWSGKPFSIRRFSPYGGDERQFCSPGFNLPVGSLMRSAYGEFPEYHTSADDLTLVRSEYLAESLDQYLSVCRLLAGNQRLLNCSPKCEPQLGRRGLYDGIGGDINRRQRELALLWVLNLSDGGHSLLDIADRSDLPFDVIATAARALTRAGLLREIAVPSETR